MTATRRPTATLAVWKFASCDGCQLTVLNLEDELLALADTVDIRLFLEAGPAADPGNGQYDLSLVEGSITTPDDLQRIRLVRQRSRRLITIGAGTTYIRGDARADRVTDRNERRVALTIPYDDAGTTYLEFVAGGCPVQVIKFGVDETSLAG